MQAIRSILVVIEADHADSLALKRARLIAGVTGAHLHLLICDKKKHPHTAVLVELKRRLHDEGFSATTEQAWHETLHNTIIKVQQAEGCGLVIKQHFPDNPIKKALLTPEDWKLLRLCPSPVLMVKTDRPWNHGVVLAAVDVGNEDGAHKALHYSIIDHGYDIAAVAKASLHVIAAHPSPMLSAANPVFQQKESIEARYREQCQVFQTQFDVTHERLHIAEGPADVLIPFTARQLGAAVTIIGTVARTGIPAALIGNTAEVVLDSLESDVLVLKTEEIIGHLEGLLG